MADYGHQGQQQHPGTGAHGNPVGQKDQFGNPIHHTGGGTTGDYGSGAGTEAYDQSSQLRRSGSSSSEEDGIGGRRKKGVGEKIKEKLPGVGHKKEGEQLPGVGHKKEGEQPYGGGGGGYGSAAAGVKEKLPGVGHKKEGEQPYGGGFGSAAAGEEQQREKKGMMEKIKDKMPGGGAGGHQC